MNDWLLLAAKIVEAWAWPITVIAIALLFRAPLSKLLSRIRRARGRDWEIDLEQELETASQSIASVPSLETRADANLQLMSIDPRWQKLAEEHPDLAVIQIWREIEEKLVQLARKKDYSGRPSVKLMLSYLSQRQILDPGVIETIESLAKIRNAIVHSNRAETTTGEALEVVLIASKVSAVLSLALH